MNEHQRVVKLLVNNLGYRAIEIVDITSGHSGFVYKVKTASDQTLVIKLTPPQEEMPLGEELVDYRVHATRLTNFPAAFKLFQEKKLKTFNLFDYGVPSTQIPFYYQAMSFLEGSSIREFLTHGAFDKIYNLEKVTGEAFARLHQTTRSFDGWVNQVTPYKLPWSQAFFISLESRLAKSILINSGFINKNISQINKFISAKLKAWSDPKEFVFSQLDGLQAMAKLDQESWEFSGYIDIEDHKFTDQRFVLAGFEYALELEGRTLTDSFWKAYEGIKEVDSSYRRLKGLFQLYFALAYLPILFENGWVESSNQKLVMIKRFEKLISKIIS